MPGGGIEQGRITAHVGVVTQAGAGALGFGDPGLAFAIDHPQAHQLAGFPGQAIEDRLDDIRPAPGQVTKAQGNQFGAQVVAAVFRVLAHIAQAHQLTEHAVGGALGNVQLLCEGLHGQPVGVAGEAFEKAQRAFDLTACHGHGS
ncbi:hypothetical protein D3C86_1762260 [compost metagenome]